MIKITLIILLLIAGVVIPARFAVEQSGFISEGVVEGLQSCKKDEDCIWVPTSCCNCDYGGGEMLINRQKEYLFNVLVRPICFGENVCTGSNACHTEEVFCDRTCKFGDRTYTKPLLSQ